jgi:uncharacterized protein (TIGR02284 family)
MSEQSISVLNNLIQVNKDTEEGFRTAAENVEDTNLKKIFLTKANTYQLAVTSLQGHVAKMNGEYEENGTLLGSIHRGWINIKGALTGKDSHAILVECEKGEDIVKAAYTKALEQNLQQNVRSLIHGQYETVIKDHDQIRDLRDNYGTSI